MLCYQQSSRSNSESYNNERTRQLITPTSNSSCTPSTANFLGPAACRQRPDSRNSHPANHNDCHGQPDLAGHIGSRGVEADVVHVLDCPRVLGGDGKRLHGC